MCGTLILSPLAYSVIFSPDYTPKLNWETLKSILTPVPPHRGAGVQPE